MATFNIKRGDSMPPLIISMRIAGTSPEEFYNFDKDDVGGQLNDNAGPLPSGVFQVKFIMTDLNTGKVVGLPENVANRFTGFGTIYQQVIPGEFEDIGQTIPKKKTLIRYNWQQPATAYDAVTNPTAFAGDTGIAGVYSGEFEIIYATSDTGSQRRKRTFPTTPGDTIIVNILPDSNDKRANEPV